MLKFCTNSLLLLLIVLLTKSFGQKNINTLNFHRLGVAQGLHDGLSRCIAQDRYGFIWIGTVGGYNRYDGQRVRQFTSQQGDDTSPYASHPRCMYSDKAGRFWIGCERGLMEYNFQKGNFRRVSVFDGKFIYGLLAVNDSILYVGTRTGLYSLNTKSGRAFYWGSAKSGPLASLYHNRILSMASHGPYILLGTPKGLVYFDWKQKKATLSTVPELQNLAILSIAPDKEGAIWMTSFDKYKLLKLKPNGQQVRLYDSQLTEKGTALPLNVTGLIVDNKNTVWAITVIDGLMEYIPKTDTFIKHKLNYNLPSSPVSNDYRCIFQDKEGTIWLGYESAGVGFFKPDQKLFQTIMPYADSLDIRSRRTGRAIAVDPSGAIWMGNHDGLSKLDTAGHYHSWHNYEGKKPVLYSNLVRSLHADEHGNVWIGTAAGVNFYNKESNKIEFIATDKLPASFYNAINADKSGNIWFCTNDSETLYWYSKKERKFYPISAHKHLARYKGMAPTSYVFEDSKNRLWISVSRQGVIMLDKKSGQTKHYKATGNKGEPSIISNVVVAIDEDKQGLIWLSTFHGLSAIDVTLQKITNYNNRQGLPGNMACPMVIDGQSRVWVGVNGGLTLLSTNRKEITTFGIGDGLASVGFPEHGGILTSNGTVYMPTYNGYLRFNPNAYSPVPRALQFYIDSYSLFNKKYTDLNEASQPAEIRLKPAQNSFTFNLVALNYLSPGQSWFAYRLLGFEDAWHYSQDPKAVYTNIPGGSYTFEYKAATHNAGWQAISAKQVHIYLQTVFYKTWLFYISMGLLLAATIMAMFRYRVRQQRQVYELQHKTQLLEKEKALVMYESLKQQLNPHFLFNSLTSLGGLIEYDQKMASDFLQKMSGIYRYILKNSDTETVSLQDEIEFANMYVGLQKTRFKSGLQVHMNIPESYLAYKIAPVTLQNMIENAVKHNVMDESAPLVIQVGIEDEYLVISNNLQRKNAMGISNKQGLKQLIRLYHFLSSLPIQITESSTHFTIKIPLI